MKKKPTKQSRVVDLEELKVENKERDIEGYALRYFTGSADEIEVKGKEFYLKKEDDSLCYVVIGADGNKVTQKVPREKLGNLPLDWFFDKELVESVFSAVLEVAHENGHIKYSKKKPRKRSEELTPITDSSLSSSLPHLPITPLTPTVEQKPEANPIQELTPKEKEKVKLLQLALSHNVIHHDIARGFLQKLIPNLGDITLKSPADLPKEEAVEGIDKLHWKNLNAKVKDLFDTIKNDPKKISEAKEPHKFKIETLDKKSLFNKNEKNEFIGDLKNIGKHVTQGGFSLDHDKKNDKFPIASSVLNTFYSLAESSTLEDLIVFLQEMNSRVFNKDDEGGAVLVKVGDEAPPETTLLKALEKIETKWAQAYMNRRDIKLQEEKERILAQEKEKQAREEAEKKAEAERKAAMAAAEARAKALEEKKKRILSEVKTDIINRQKGNYEDEFTQEIMERKKLSVPAIEFETKRFSAKITRAQEKLNAIQGEINNYREKRNRLINARHSFSADHKLMQLKTEYYEALNAQVKPLIGYEIKQDQGVLEKIEIKNSALIPMAGEGDATIYAINPDDTLLFRSGKNGSRQSLEDLMIDCMGGTESIEKEAYEEYVKTHLIAAHAYACQVLTANVEENTENALLRIEQTLKDKATELDEAEKNYVDAFNAVSKEYASNPAVNELITHIVRKKAEEILKKNEKEYKIYITQSIVGETLQGEKLPDVFNKGIHYHYERCVATISKEAAHFREQNNAAEIDHVLKGAYEAICQREPGHAKSKNIDITLTAELTAEWVELVRKYVDKKIKEEGQFKDNALSKEETADLEGSIARYKKQVIKDTEAARLYLNKHAIIDIENNQIHLEEDHEQGFNEILNKINEGNRKLNELNKIKKEAVEEERVKTVISPLVNIKESLTSTQALSDDMLKEIMAGKTAAEIFENIAKLFGSIGIIEDEKFEMAKQLADVICRYYFNGSKTDTEISWGEDVPEYVFFAAKNSLNTYPREGGLSNEEAFKFIQQFLIEYRNEINNVSSDRKRSLDRVVNEKDTRMQKRLDEQDKNPTLFTSAFHAQKKRMHSYLMNRDYTDIDPDAWLSLLAQASLKTKKKSENSPFIGAFDASPLNLKGSQVKRDFEARRAASELQFITHMQKEENAEVKSVFDTKEKPKLSMAGVVPLPNQSALLDKIARQIKKLNEAQSERPNKGLLLLSRATHYNPDALRALQQLDYVMRQQIPVSARDKLLFKARLGKALHDAKTEEIIVEVFKQWEEAAITSLQKGIEEELSLSSFSFKSSGKE